MCMVCVCVSAVQVAIKKVYAAADVSFSKGEVTVDTSHPAPVTIKVSSLRCNTNSSAVCG